MDLMAGSKTTATVAAVVMFVGLSIILYGLVYDDTSRSLDGAFLTVPSLVLLALVAVRSWILDAAAERRILEAAVRETQAERTTYIAAKAALVGEQNRIARDRASERAALAAQLTTEREAMLREFQERRASLISETMEATVLMIRDGKLAPSQLTSGTVIQFPNQMPAVEQERARERSRERSHEHGFVGP